MARRGPRPGGADTRADILVAAERAFAEQGYDGATVRRIAATAGVDPSMINHHFGGKDELLMAVLELPMDPQPMVAAVLGASPTAPGAALLRRALAAWESGPGQLTIGMLRSSLHRDRTVGLVRQLLERRVLAPIMAEMTVPEAERPWRVSLLATQMLGLIMMRYVIRIEPLASADHDQIVTAVGPTIDRYLQGDVD
ncbi:MAG: TetR family transcriptional regulator [Propionibacteriales bacterium]|nr:TetR family transcriptional regulator [Propionibacteriales bacterium]